MVPKKLFLIDGSSYFFRAFYAIGRLSNSQGLPTNAIFGFTNMLLKVVNQHQPDYLAVVFDSPGPSFRKKIYDAYKANRSAMPEDLAAQIPFIKEIVRAYRIPSFELSGFEADDIIATLVKRFEKEIEAVTIVSGDKDLMQLVNERVCMLDTMNDKTYGEKEVIEKFGVPPGQLLEVFALAGDASDNIPGVPGIGLKTAASLIKDFKALKDLLENVAAGNGKGKAEKVRAHADQALLSRKLLTLDEAVPVACELSALNRQQPDLGVLRALFEKFEFKKLLSELGATPQEAKKEPIELSADPVSREQYRLLTSISDIERYVERVRNHNLPVSIDLETTSREPMRAAIVGISLCAEPGQAVYLPLAHEDASVTQPPLNDVLAILKPMIEDEKIPKRGQHIKYDDVVLRKYGVKLQGLEFDSLLASYLLRSEERSGHDLDSLALRYLAHRNISYEEVTEGIADGAFAKVPVEKAMAYSGEDADVAFRLAEAMSPQLLQEGVDAVFRQLELPLSCVLAAMEHRGIAIDQRKLGELSQSFEHELQEITRKIYEFAGESFTINSPKQLQKILFEKLGLPRGRKTKTGHSTDTEVLVELARLHELPHYLLRYRLLSKLKSTYVDSLPLLVNPQTGRIHTRFNQAIAATGRLSSSDPNLQNIPIRGAEGQLIRAAFVPAPDRAFLGADYSQIELRMFAHFSEDETLVQAYREDLDIHSLTAQAVFNVTQDQLNSEMRRKAKVVNFGILYGMSEFRLGRELGISTREGADFIQRYFARYPGVRKFLDQTIAEARECGYVKTYLGHKRRFPDLNSRNVGLRRAAERAACSTVIQGSAADLIKTAMVNVERSIQKAGLQARMILQVHDELVFELPVDEKSSCEAIVKAEMENVWSLKVPIIVETRLGNNWLEAH